MIRSEKYYEIIAHKILAGKNLFLTIGREAIHLSGMDDLKAGLSIESVYTLE